MPRFASAVFASTLGAAAFLAAGSASAQYPAPSYYPPAYPQPYAQPYPQPYGPAYPSPPAAPAPPTPPAILHPPGTPPPPVEATPDGVAVGSPAQPVDVHASTPDGTVHAYGCKRVEVDPNGRSTPVAPGAGCAPIYVPYPVYMVPYAPYYVPYARRWVPPKPAHEPDPARTTGIVLGATLFGLGTLAGGTAALVEASARERCKAGFTVRGCGDRTAEQAGYWTMGVAVVAPAGLPRLIVGDVGMELLFTGLRAGSFAAGSALRDHADPAVPVMFSFVIPATLSLVDLLTVPHRDAELKRLRERERSAKSTFHLDGIAPTVTADARGSLAPAIGALGRF